MMALFIRHEFDLSHVVMKDILFTAIIPLDGYSSPIRFDDGAKVGLILLPANAVIHSQLS
jgi:hypothetical protein